MCLSPIIFFLKKSIKFVSCLNLYRRKWMAWISPSRFVLWVQRRMRKDKCVLVRVKILRVHQTIAKYQNGHHSSICIFLGIIFKFHFNGRVPAHFRWEIIDVAAGMIMWHVFWQLIHWCGNASEDVVILITRFVPHHPNP